MFRFPGNILFAVLTLISVSLLGSCRHHDYFMEEEEDIIMADGMSRLAIHVSPVATRNGASSVNEMIKSFRIIIINESTATDDGSESGNPGSSGTGNGQPTVSRSVEFNDLIIPEYANGIEAIFFRYDVLYQTTPGNKKFYFIANEDFVNNWQLPDGISITWPEGLDADSSFSELVGYFESGNQEVELLEQILANLYFVPDYTRPSTNGYVYLPYTSVYDYTPVAKGEVKELEMFVVPAAAKFTFNFTNYRYAPVNINGLTMSSANIKTNLLAHVGETDFYKTLPNETKRLYWVDWLEAVSKESQNYPGASENQWFNSNYGWIKDYYVPEEGDLEPDVFFEATPEEVDGTIITNALVVPGVTITGEGTPQEVTTPGTFTAGPYYVAESINLSPANEPGKKDQAYYLTINWEDQGEGKVAPDFEDNLIPNLEALFRNTHVIINIIMRQGDIKIYAEISPWNIRSSYGWVTEE